MEALLAAVIAGVMTWLDLDATFQLSTPGSRRARLWSWLGGFILLNAALAAGTYLVVRNMQPFKDWNQLTASAVAGVSYLAIVHSQVATFTWQGAQVPLGIELFYRGAKQSAYKRINRIAKEALVERTLALAQEKDLDELAIRARLDIVQDALLLPAEKGARKSWLTDVLNDTTMDEAEKRRHLATYILSGEKST